MSSDVPDWIRRANGLWGRQKRRIWCGHDWHGNVDGYAQSLLGRIREERDGAGQGTPSQRWPEVFWGDGLDVQRSLVGMPETPYAVLHLHYVWDPEWGYMVRHKARLVGIAERSYWAALERAEIWVFAKLCTAEERLGLRVSEAAETCVTVLPVKPRAPLDFAALDRATLGLKSSARK